MFAPSKLRTHLLQAQAMGYRPEQILDGSGVAWSEIEALQPVGLDTIARLFDFLARRTHPGFAIEAGHASTLQIYGVVGAATMRMPTLRAAFEHWSRYYLVSGDPIVTSISEQDDHWSMHFEPRCLMSSEARRFCIETSVAALEPVIEELTDASASTLKIDFSSSRPSRQEDYRVFGTDNVRFNRRSTIYYGKRSDLDRPIPLRDGSAGEVFLRHCDEYLATLTNSELDPRSARQSDVRFRRQYSVAGANGQGHGPEHPLFAARIAYSAVELSGIGQALSPAAGQDAATREPSRNQGCGVPAWIQGCRQLPARLSQLDGQIDRCMAARADEHFVRLERARLPA